MSKKRDMEIRHKAEDVAFALKARGIYHLPNDHSGLASAVAWELRRMHPEIDFLVEEPPHRFGGEHVFRLAQSTKPEGGDA